MAKAKKKGGSSAFAAAATRVKATKAKADKGKRRIRHIIKILGTVNTVLGKLLK